ncbi:hypothetical protein NESM_000209500 [Novymonas esmeraldas]|uniref:Uncharacterized protein n=1 Tax=Novymonas esmeraldas TaxID=1808958 RepID=A0AAW0F5M7_9TRYP
MGGVCSRSKTKAARPPAQGSANNAAERHDSGVAARADVTSGVAANLNDGGAADRVDGAAEVRGSPHVLGDSLFTLSTTDDPQQNGADRARGSVVSTASAPSPKKTTDADPHALVAPVAVAASSAGDDACPHASQVAPGFSTYFPPEHDARMRLGAGKYSGVGASPLSEQSTPELHSFSSSSPLGDPREPRHSGAGNHGGGGVLRRGTAPPAVFADDDTSAVDTASSIFATPRELFDGSSSVAGLANNLSILSHGSMTSARPHGYSFYNSSNTFDGDYNSVTPSDSSRLPSARTAMTAAATPHRHTGASLPRTLNTTTTTSVRRTPNTLTVTNVRTNQRVPTAASVGGVSSSFTRQSSIARSDRFHSCRSVTAASSPAAAASLRLPGSPGSAQPFYTCRSAYTPATESLSLASPAPPRRPAGATGHLLPPGSAATSPRVAAVAGSASPAPRSLPRSAQPLYGQQQSSRGSFVGDAPASEVFFSVPPSAGDVFLDLPAAVADDACGERGADSATAPAAAVAAVGQQQQRPGGAAASPASHYSSSLSVVETSASSSNAASPVADGGGGGDGSSSAPSSWLDPPASMATAVPAVRRQYYTRDDFPPNPSPPPAVQRARAAAAAAAPVAVAAPPPPPPPSAPAKAAVVVGSPSAPVTAVGASVTSTAVSPESAARTHVSGTGSRATRRDGGRLTQPFIDADDNARAAPAVEVADASTHSFSMVVDASSCHNDYRVPASSSSSSGPSRRRSPPVTAAATAPARVTSQAQRPERRRPAPRGGKSAPAQRPRVVTATTATATAAAAAAPASSDLRATSRRPAAAIVARADEHAAQRTAGGTSPNSSRTRRSSTPGDSRHARARTLAPAGAHDATATTRRTPAAAARRRTSTTTTTTTTGAPAAAAARRPWATRARKAARTPRAAGDGGTAPAQHSATAATVPQLSAAAAPPSSHPDAESVVEYSLSLGDTTGSERLAAHVTPVAADDDGDDADQWRRTPAAAATSPPAQRPHTLAAHVEHGRAEPRALESMLRPYAAQRGDDKSDFLHPYTEAQLAAHVAAQRNGGDPFVFSNGMHHQDRYDHSGAALGGGGGGGSEGDGAYVDERATIAAAFASVVAQHTLSSNEGDGAGHLSVSAASGEDGLAAAQLSSGAWSGGVAPMAKRFGAATVPAGEGGATPRRHGVYFDSAGEDAAVELSSRTSSVTSGVDTSEAEEVKAH